MNKLILSPLTLLKGEAFTNDKGDIFKGLGSFHEAYGERTVREIQLLAFGKAAERLKDIAIGSKLETSGEYRSETKDLGNGKKEYLNIFLINKITRVGKPSEVNEAPEVEQEAAISPTPAAKQTAQKTKVAPVYTPPVHPTESSDPDYDSIPF
jgi:hypothetical protein